MYPTSGGVRLVENTDRKLMQITFPAKPGAVMRDKLKRAGFTCVAGVWQRPLTRGGIITGRRLIEVE